MIPDDALVLGVETSCDECAAAVVRGGDQVLSNAVARQHELHAEFGGVVPEIANREHTRVIIAVLDRALREADTTLDDLHGIAATCRPGLTGSLVIGLTAAKGVSAATGLPLAGVDHLQAHAWSACMDPVDVDDRPADPPDFPFVSLAVSGGHTTLTVLRSPLEHEPLGATIDDAAGEAFDKVAAVLGLPYPGGPEIEKAAGEGDPEAFDFPRPTLEPDSLDFSFSGLKTAVLYRCCGTGTRKGHAEIKEGIRIEDVAASFQAAVADVLAEKCLRAAQAADCTAVGVGGGVAINKTVRRRIHDVCAAQGVRAVFARPALCGDNGAMIAGLGFHLLRAGRTAGMDLGVSPRPEVPGAGRSPSARR